MSRLNETFAAAKAENRAVLIAYLPAGFPTVLDSMELISTMVENGVDIVEVGLPYSDPLMDGPVIQEAVDKALKNGTRLADVHDVVAHTAELGAPALVMSYWNPIEKTGVDRFAADLATDGGVGVITPDLTPEEADAWVTATDEAGIDRVFLAAISSTDARLDKIAEISTGFVYAASTMGVTGVRSTVGDQAAHLVERIRQHTHVPVCVGLGVSSGEQAAEVATYADGVIVGSAFVKAIQNAPTIQEAHAAVGKLSRELSHGVRSRGRQMETRETT